MDRIPTPTSDGAGIILTPLLAFVFFWAPGVLGGLISWVSTGRCLRSLSFQERFLGSLGVGFSSIFFFFFFMMLGGIALPILSSIGLQLKNP
jgi:hypothetical protein